MVSQAASFINKHYIYLHARAAVHSPTRVAPDSRPRTILAFDAAAAPARRICVYNNNATFT